MIRCFTCLLLLLALLPELALAQTPGCPRIWRSGDSLLTDPAPHIQWYRDGMPIPNANDRAFIPTQPGRYSVEVSSEPSTPYRFHRNYVLEGYVFDELRRPVEGATVQWGAFRTTTDGSGRFVLRIPEPKPADQTPVVLHVGKTGYWKNSSRQYLSRFHTTETQILLQTKWVTNRVDATRGGELVYRGFELHIPPDAVQTESGMPYSGTILLRVEGSRPVDPDFGLRMPGGDFMAMDADGNEVMLHSYGYLTVEMETESGEKLELRPEARATLRFHLPHTEGHRPDSVPLWHFDPDRALWIQEGWSVRNGSIYEGEVSHFSSWNCDWPEWTGICRGRVVDCNGGPLVGSSVRVGQRFVVTDSLGEYTSFVPGGIEFDAWAAVDTLRGLRVPARQERTLDDLSGQNFGGLAVYTPQTQELAINLSGRVPADVLVSIDSGQTWTAERQFTGLERKPEYVVAKAACVNPLQVIVLREQDAYRRQRREDCRRLSWEDTTIREYVEWQAALDAEEPVYRLSFSTIGSFGDRWDWLELFPCLIKLDMSNQQLTAVPESIGKLSNLQALGFMESNLKTLPESIGNLSNLQGLNLPKNQLDNLPASFGNLSSLETLDISSNRLDELPESFGKLTNLQTLNLDNNQLNKLPIGIGNLLKLINLHLNGNNLTELPDSICSLIQLLTLTLDDNWLTKLPARIGNLNKLQTLMLAHNRLEWLPASISNLTDLQQLNMTDNRLTSLPDSFGKLTSLQELFLTDNRLTSLPDGFGKLTSLQVLSLHNNRLNQLPTGIGDLTRLKLLLLFNNQLETLPASIGNLTNLRELNLSNNQLATLPDSIGKLTSLQVLDLSFNRLNRLPDSIGNLTNLQRLNIGFNKLIALPESIGNLSSLDTLDIFYNRLTALPVSIGSLVGLRRLDLSNNELTDLPASIGNLTSLASLTLSNNELTDLPASIGNLTNLQHLNLNYNQLTDLPAIIGNLTGLQRLDLRGNPIPVERRAAIQALLPNTQIIW